MSGKQRWTHLSPKTSRYPYGRRLPGNRKATVFKLKTLKMNVELKNLENCIVKKIET